MNLDLENEEITDEKWWKQTHKEIEEAKVKFIASDKIGGNPLSIPNDALKNKVLKNRRK